MIINLFKACNEFLKDEDEEERIRVIEAAFRNYDYDPKDINQETEEQYWNIKQQLESIRTMVAMIHRKN